MPSLTTWHTSATRLRELWPRGAVLSSTFSPATHHSSPGLAQGSSWSARHRGPASTAMTGSGPPTSTGPSAQRSSTLFTGSNLRCCSGSLLPGSRQQVPSIRALVLDRGHSPISRRDANDCAGRVRLRSPAPRTRSTRWRGRAVASSAAAMSSTGPAPLSRAP